MGGDTATLRSLLTYTRDGEWGAGYPKDGYTKMRVIRGTDFERVRQGDLTTVPTRYIRTEIAARKTLRPWDILIETAGGSRDRPTGRTLLLHPGTLENVEAPLTCASFARFLRVDRNRVDASYVYWFLQCLYYNGEMERHQVQHTGVARFQFTNFADSLEIPLPSLPEQRAIAHLLGTLDDKIELNRRMNETLEEMARALFKSWFVDFDPVRAKMEGRWRPGESLPGLPAHLYDLFPDRLVPSELADIPEGWVVKTLGEVATIVGGTTPSTKEPQYWEGGIHCWATPKDLSALSVPVLLETERRITDAGLGKIGSGLLPGGTVLLSSRAPIGYLAIAEVPVAVNQGFIALLAREWVSNLFLLYWCETAHEEIVNHANGSTFLEISKGNFRQLIVVMPDSSAMAMFDRGVRLLYERIVSNERETRTLAAQRDALLPKLVSGEIRVGHPESIIKVVE